ncbi:hypothetical protein LOC51_00445 [Rubrivivax sp. JA1024]|nr:hypothetical protein [Rubrivivax sp. JA1024]
MPDSDERYYICDLREEWRGKPCVTFWRPDNAGYAYPLPWSGQYTLNQLVAEPGYYWGKPFERPRAAFIRFPVPCRIVDQLGSAPTPGLVDGDVGPIVWKTPRIVRRLREKMLPLPQSKQRGKNLSEETKP